MPSCRRLIPRSVFFRHVSGMSDAVTAPSECNYPQSATKGCAALTSCIFADYLADNRVDAVLIQVDAVLIQVDAVLIQVEPNDPSPQVLCSVPEIPPHTEDSSPCHGPKVQYDQSGRVPAIAYLRKPQKFHTGTHFIGNPMSGDQPYRYEAEQEGAIYLSMFERSALPAFGHGSGDHSTS